MLVGVATTSSRTLTLLSLLQSRREWSGVELAARLAVSARTVRRDVETLRELGYPVHTSRGPDGGYRLGAGSTLPPLLFDDDQAVAVALALQTAPVTVTGIDEGAERALAALGQVMPARLQAEVDALRLTTVRNYWAFSAPPIAPEVLKAVGNAVHRGHLLRVELLRPDGSRPDPHEPDFAPPLRIEPHHLVLWAGRWYLVARVPDRDDWLVHRVDRLHVHDPTGRSFRRHEVPGGDVTAFVMSSHQRGDTVQEWPCLGTVLIDLPADVVARWAPAGAVVEQLDAERSRFVLGAWSWAGVVGILATFDADVVVEGPEQLRTAFTAVARRLHRAGSGPAAPGRDDTDDPVPETREPGRGPQIRPRGSANSDDHE